MDRSPAQPPFLVPLLLGQRRREYFVWLSIWIYATASFWFWWLNAAHNIGAFRYAVISAVLFWVNLLPAYFLIIFARARVPNPQLPPPANARVAMIATKTPSEPFEVVRETLLAMLRQDYAGRFDVWLADEDPSPETASWCKQHGVLISTRRGIAAYHRQTWPRRTRCKEGNLAYFYDTFGYKDYDFVSQFDADHVPKPTYLTEVLRPFADRAVGYVSAPSICDKNARNSWSARGRLYVEASLHGALEAGYSGGLAPLCIGSHYAVRTAALKSVGGLGPELAEDHSTTLLMNAGGWRGVHAINAIAHGDGPESFSDMAVQEFQWSRSLMTLLLKYTPNYLSRLPVRLKLQFLFCQFWYPLFSVFMLLMATIPVFALIFDRNMVGVTYPEFIIRFSAPSAVLIAMAFSWRRNGWLRPRDAKLFSWEGTVFLFARWPWALLGVLTAVTDVLRGTTAQFKVTPKGGKRCNLPMRVVMPYVILTSISAVPALMLPDIEEARGFYVFAIINAAIYAIVLGIIVYQEFKSGTMLETLRPIAGPLAAFSLAVAIVGATIAVRGGEGMSALATGSDLIVARVELLWDTWRQPSLL